MNLPMVAPPKEWIIYPIHAHKYEGEGRVPVPIILWVR
jgi:hypothetical protein